LKKHMYRVLSAVLLVGLFATIVSVHADAPKTEMVKFPSGKETIEGYLAVPEKPGRYPAVIVVHEWWGLNEWVKEQTQKIAEQGYVALAVDLYRGKSATTPEEAHELMRALAQDRAVRDLQAGYDYLATRQDVNGRIAALGWCMGGGYALQLAIHQPRLSACVVNYGALPTDPNDIQQIALRAPISACLLYTSWSTGAIAGYGVLASCACACHAAPSTTTSAKLPNAIVLSIFRFI